MKQFFTRFLTMVVLVMSTLSVFAQQLPDSGFENWNGDKFDGEVQLKNWHGSNVEQVGMKFNFLHRETGRNGYCVMVQDQDVGAMGITETSPGYVSLGQPWQYLPSITQIGKATAGTYGSIDFTYRPDSMIVWVKRTGNNWQKEDFHLLFYSWKGTAKGSKYKNKNNGCTDYSLTDEESDIRLALNGNECGTDVKGTEIAEGWLRDRKEYTNWTRLCVPIYYLNDEVPEKCNVILSASNYPNFRANDGLYTGNSLYADDIELIYSSKIQSLYFKDGSSWKEWKGFDPNSTDEQVYSVGRTTVVPEVMAMRGKGSLTNPRNTTVEFPGRRLSGSEISIQYGQVDGDPTVITVKSGDGKSTTTYKIKMVQEESNNAKLNSILIDGEPLAGFNPSVVAYNVALPYGTTQTPVVDVVQAEDKQKVTITQATSTSGKATINVTAADGKTKMTYTVSFSVAQLSDNTLAGIKINGKALDDFAQSQTSYRVELPLGTTTMPKVEAVSAYPAGAQTIVYTAPDKIDGGQYKISVSAPGNTVTRVYKLNFVITASSNSKLSDLKMGDYITNFSPNTTVYYVNLPIGTTQVPEITYTKGDEYQTVVINYGTVDSKSTITVTAGNGSQTVYQIYCSVAKSDNSSLKNIYLDGEPLEGFSPATYHYTVNLPIGVTTIPTVTYDQGDEFQQVQVNYGGLNATTRIFVTAGDGSSSLYEIYFSASQANVSTLEMITVGGVPVEGFEPEKTEYYITLPQGTTTLPEIGYTQHDEWQKVIVLLGDVNSDTKITVISQAGTKTVYVLHFSVTTSANTALAAVYIDGKLYEDYDPTVYEYEINLPAGVSQVPAVSFKKGEDSQKVVATLEGSVWTLRVISESGAQATYVFRFIIQKSENAFLNMIYLGDYDHPLEGFRKDLFEYDVVLTTTVCPTILVDKDPSQHVLITTPAATGTARIVVTPEAGAPNTYYIYFTSSVLPHLNNIYVNGSALRGFKSSVYDYEVEYSGALPVITYEAEEGMQTTMATDDSHVRIYVEADGVVKVYTLTFVHVLSSDATLRSIAVNGVTLADYEADKLDYTMALPADGKMPVVTYERKNESQHVVAGQTAQYAYSLVVTAESGATNTYTVSFTTDASDDTQLGRVMLDGVEVTFGDDNTYSQSIEQGDELPELTYDKKEEQTVISAQTGALEQQVVVIAEDGSTDTYTVKYDEVIEVNASLKAINIQLDEQWQPLQGFAKDVFEYDINLPWGTKVVPCIWPVSDKQGQTITITYGEPGEVTTIHVESSNGETNDYSLNFNVAKSSNTKLKKLIIDGDDYLDETDIILEVAFGTTDPYEVEFEKAYESQLIEYISAPVTEVSKIIVTAENGDTRTYTIRYRFVDPKGENYIRKVEYEYMDATGMKTDSVVPQPGDNKIKLPYGTQYFSVTKYECNYKEQSVLFYNGGVRRGATLIVSANREGEEDVVYTLTPDIPELDTVGKLKDLKYKGETVPYFRPDVYNYIIYVDAEPDPKKDFKKSTFKAGVPVDWAIDSKKKQITFTVQNGETYSVCWFYDKDGKYQKDGKYYDYLDFSQDWVATTPAAMWKASWTSSAEPTGTTRSTGFKPYGWSVPADYCAGLEYEISLGSLIGNVVDLFWYTGKEVISAGTNGAMLSTINGASINGSVPGMMTLGGTMALTPGKSGGSTSSISYNAANFIKMRNTPDSLSMRYKSLSATNVQSWYLELKTVVGTNTTRTNTFQGDYNNASWRYASIAIPAYTDAMAKYALTINSAHTDNAGDMTGSNTIFTSDLQVENVHFVYNSDLTAVTVNGNQTEQAGKTFTYQLAEGDDVYGVPALKFTGAVHDQTQKIEWLNNGEWKDGMLTARVVNYGENRIDSTVYNVVLKRTAVTTLVYTADFGGYPTTVAGDTTYVDMPFGTKSLPNFAITPGSIHQRFNIDKIGNAVKVTVQAEDGNSRTDVYVFREIKTADATLANLTATGLKQKDDPSKAFDKDVTEYVVSAEYMPVVNFVKQRSAEDKDLGQTVILKYTAEGATVTVTSADGSAEKTYTIAFTQVIPSTSGSLSMLTRDNEPLQEFESSKLDYTKPYSDNIGFTRMDGQNHDRVVETITDTRVTVTVTGVDEASGKTYTITYPTEQSTNTDLGGIVVNGEPYAEFTPIQTSYIYESDEPLDVRFILSEPVQTMAISISGEQSDAPERKTKARSKVTVITVIITAENGDTKQYTFTIQPERSDISTLAGISVAGKPLEDFYPEKLTYTYVIASETPKLKEPDMPEVTYTLGQESQSVSVEPAKKLGDAVLITVTPENGNEIEASIYKITFTSEQSHNAELADILVNGNSISDFRPSRTFYSMQLTGSEENVQIDYAVGDPFQTVEVSTTAKGYQLYVTAQDGVTNALYEVEIWRTAKSNNANLADILLDNISMSEYAKQHGVEDLAFNEKIYYYTIPLTASDTMPDISARLQDDAQTVEISKVETAKGTIENIHVTAEDGESSNDYQLLFAIEKSSNTRLAMILLNGDSLSSFDSNTFDYIIALPLGERRIPSVDAIKSEMVQSLEVDTLDDGMRFDLIVTAEDGSQAIYSVKFSFTYSDNDLLKRIVVDSTLIEGFRPDSFYYTLALPMGVRTLPYLDFVPGDQYQLPQYMDTIVTTYRTTYQCKVTAEDSVHTNTYTVVCEILPSDVDTLKSLYIVTGETSRMLKGFDPHVVNYTDTLPIGITELPSVKFVEGDEFQTIDTVCNVESRTITVKVTAEDGHSRTYAIYFVSELSHEAALGGITVGGKPLDNFDPMTLSYLVELPYGTTMLPNVVCTKAEDAQNVTVSEQDMQIQIQVTAEDGVTTLTYVVNFVVAKSSEAHLASLAINDEPLAGFRADSTIYTIVMPYGTTVFPAAGQVTAVPVDENAMVDVTADGRLITVTVLAQDSLTEMEYIISFEVEPCSINWLDSLIVNGHDIHFHRDTMTYVIAHPVGSDSTALVHADDVTYILADSTETVEIYESDGTITIQVTPENQQDIRVYMITQYIRLNGNSLLADLTINGKTIKGFSDSLFMYSYIVQEAEVVTVKAVAQDSLAEVNVPLYEEGEPMYVTCTAQDGSKSTYTIIFEKSTINDAQDPTAGDVLIKQIPGTDQIAAYTIRMNTWFAVYDHYGHLMLNVMMPTCNPNDATVVIDHNGNDKLINATGDCVTYTIPTHGQTFFYLIYTGNTRLQSGKLMLQ